MVLGFEADTPIAPIEAALTESNTGNQVRPELFDFHTPPPADPK